MPCHSSHNRTRCCSGSARACHKMCPDRSRHIQSGTQCVGSDGNTGTWRLLDLLWINNWINPTLSTLTQITMIVGLFLVTDLVSPFMGTNLCWPQSAKAITAWRYHTPHRQPARNRDRRRDSSLWTPLWGNADGWPSPNEQRISHTFPRAAGGLSAGAGTFADPRVHPPGTAEDGGAANAIATGFNGLISALVT